MTAAANYTTCNDCGYRVSAHFTTDGRPLGCPTRLTGRTGEEHQYPRVMIRVGLGTRRDHVLVIFADCYDEDTDSYLHHDLTAGDQYFASTRKRGNRLSIRAPRDIEERAKEDIEHEIGGRVRVVYTAHSKVK